MGQAYSYVRNSRFGYPTITGVSALVAPTAFQLRMHSVACVNASPSACNIGIGYYLGANGSFVYTASGGAATPYVSGPYLDSVGAQLYIQSTLHTLDFISFFNSVVASGGAPTYLYEYWNGSAFVSFTPQVIPDFTQNTTGLIFSPALNFVRGSGGVVGLDSSRRTIRITVLTAPTIPQQSLIYPCKLIIYREAIEAKQTLEVNFEENQFLLAQGETIIPYFSTANNFNTVELGFRLNP